MSKPKTPYKFQEIAIKKALGTYGYIIADACGLGKTLMAIEIAKRSRKQEPWQCLIVTPPALMSQWVEEIHDQDPGQPSDFSLKKPLFNVAARVIDEVKTLYGPGVSRASGARGSVK